MKVRVTNFTKILLVLLLGVLVYFIAPKDYSKVFDYIKAIVLLSLFILITIKSFLEWEFSKNEITIN